MSDVLIRNLPDDVIGRIDRQARRQGLSRTEFIRQELTALANRTTGPVTVGDLNAASELSADLLDEQVMREAWS